LDLYKFQLVPPVKARQDLKIARTDSGIVEDFRRAVGFQEGVELRGFINESGAIALALEEGINRLARLVEAYCAASDDGQRRLFRNAGTA
jgi:hypothetical protein